MKIKITADSTCDLPSQLLTEYEVLITPLQVVLDEQSYADRTEIEPARIFSYMTEHKTATCHTAACNVATYQQAFAQLSHYDAVIHISLGSGFSSSYDNARQAAQDFPQVHVVDSRTLCGGSGLLVERAARLAAAGLGLPEILAELEQLKPRLVGHCLLNTLEYVRRGGRCSAVSEWGANLLQLKPCIEISDKLQVGKKYRGAFTSCVKKYLGEYLQNWQDIDPDIIFLANIGCEAAVLAEARQFLAGLQYFQRVVEIEAGCVIGCHSGPSCLGLFYARKD